MSISSSHTGGNRRPSTKPAAGGKPPTGEKSAAKSTSGAKPAGSGAKGTSGAKGASGAKPAAGRPGAGKGGKRPPITPVKVNQGRNWGPIALFAVVGLVAAGIIGFGVYQVQQNSLTWQDKAKAIPGIVNYLKTEPDYLKAAQHQYGTVKYKQNPPVGGPHNPNWMQCLGNVYDAPIANEHAVHSMEHGAVWITYRPDLPKDQVDKLAAKVKGNDYMLMSPFPGLDTKVSLQAWGYQLKLNDVTDPRIDDFIKNLRVNDSQETGAVCSSGNYINTTGTTPHDLGASPAPSASTG
jgi:hypothetical protein